MINHLEGKLVEITPTYVVIDCNGVGYVLNISLHTFTAIGNLKSVKLLTHVSVNQMDYSQVAYGFIDEDERTIFRHLISVSGVGAASARMCLSSYGPSEIVQRISSGDVAALKKVKGIGDKTAQRIIVDLRDKMNKASGIATGSINLNFGNNKVREEALIALVMLGFVRNQAEKAVDKAIAGISAEDLSVEMLIKQALKTL
jgi:Holliday junction DNA helicase RuvA